jgi:aryl-alcohol dehydrogenase-like predicted oxidoreductase
LEEKVKYRFLGNSGMLISRVCLGAMTFGNPEWGCDQKTASAITRRFVDAGGNFIDTADMYSDGASEEMLGVAISGMPRDDLIIATKCWFPTGDAPNARALSRKHIQAACEASLRRMKIDHIDLYQIHGPDPYTPMEETMRALDDLVRSGKVRYIGCSNLYGWQIVKANAVSVQMGLEKFISAQHLYNLLRRDVEREILPACDDQGLGMICWSPLASGMLTGKYRGENMPDPNSRLGLSKESALPRFWFDEARKLVDLVVETAEKLGKTPAQVSLSWLLHDDRVAAPIAGARTVEQIEDNLVSGDWDLPDDAWKTLTDAMPLNLGYPKDWMDLTFQRTFSGQAEFTPRREQRLP